MKKRKQRLMTTLTASAILLTSLGQVDLVTANAENEGQSTLLLAEANTNNKDKETKDSSTASSAESMTMDEINDLEGIPQEQIVVAIEPDGYVTSHGDHFHFYNGQLPQDALFSEDILTPKDYVFNEADVVSEINGGKVVQIDGAYAIYNELGADHPGLRRIEEIYLQSFSVHPDDARALADLLDIYQLPEDSEIFYETDRLLEELTAELQEKDKDLEDPVLIFVTEEEYAVLLGMDIYVLPGAPSEDLAVSELFITDASYELNPDDVLYETTGGVIVEIDGKRYFHPSDRDTVTIVSQNTLKETVKQAHDTFVKSDGERVDAKHKVAAGGVVHESGSRNASGQYVTDDGYVFSPYHVLRDTGSGYIVPHGDHFHFIPKSDLTAAEIAIADSVLGNRSGGGSMSRPIRHSQSPANATQNNTQQEQQSTNNPTATNTPAPATIQLKENARYHENTQYVTSDGYVFSVESVTEILEDGIIGKHDNHYHYVPFRDLNKHELKALKDYAAKHFNLVLQLPDEKKVVQDTNKNVNQPEKSANQGNENQKDTEQVAQPTPSETTQEIEQNYPFDATKVVDKQGTGKDAKYIAKIDGKEIIFPASSLDTQDRAFAEMQLSLVKDDYRFEIAHNEGDLEPKLYLPVASLKMHAANATIDTGKAFVIPHIDHLHYVYYNQLTPEEIATIRFVMQNPAERPAPWTDEGHGEEDKKTFIGTIPNATPFAEREGKRNVEIIHTKEEVEAALARREFATPEGYIFKPSDILTDASYVRRFDTDISVTIHLPNGKTHSVDFDVLPAAQREEAMKYRAEYFRREAELDAQKAAEKAAAKKAADEEKALIEKIRQFLADHYGVSKDAVLYQAEQKQYLVTIGDVQLKIGHEQANTAYQGDASVLPEKPVAPSAKSKIKEATANQAADASVNAEETAIVSEEAANVEETSSAEESVTDTNVAPTTQPEAAPIVEIPAPTEPVTE